MGERTEPTIPGDLDGGRSGVQGLQTRRAPRAPRPVGPTRRHALERGNFELRRANDILMKAAAFFAQAGPNSLRGSQDIRPAVFYDPAARVSARDCISAAISRASVASARFIPRTRR